MRVCIIYDCLYPHTVGGAERWYRNVSERLAADGHQVTYLTLRQWNRGVDPGVKGVNVRVAGPRMELYASPGRRRILPPLVFGAGVLWHLLWHGRRYDVVHTASFPYFSLLAAALAWPLGRYRLVVDWHEVWTHAYWREYLGVVGGTVGWAVQLLCARVPQRAFCFSRLHAARLRAEGHGGETIVLEGEYDGPPAIAEPRPADPMIVFAGRHIPEKRVPALIPALALVRDRLPDLRAEIYGRGPELDRVREAVRRHGLEQAVAVPGFVPADTVEAALERALCMVLPSRREGYGLIVVEAAARGTPSIVVAGEDNAAVELIEEGVNGTVSSSADAEDLAAAILRVADGGAALRASTREWFVSNARRLSLAESLETVRRAYAVEAPGAPARKTQASPPPSVPS